MTKAKTVSFQGPFSEYCRDGNEWTVVDLKDKAVADGLSQETAMWLRDQLNLAFNLYDASSSARTAYALGRITEGIIRDISAEEAAPEKE